MKPLIIGESPSKRGDGRPFTGPSGRRLWSLIGVETYDEFLERFDVVNLCEDKFRLIEAQHRAMELMKSRTLEALNQRCLKANIIMCGAKVSRACLLNYHPLMKKQHHFRMTRLQFWSFPHPSGASIYWNNPEAVKLAESFLKSMADGQAPSP